MIINRVSRDEFLKEFNKSPKYHNKKTETPRGIFASKKEADFESQCFLRKNAKEIRDYSVQVPIPITVNNIHITNYIMDFVIRYWNDEIEYVETKGFKTQLWKLKWKLLKACYPNVKLTLL